MYVAIAKNTDQAVYAGPYSLLAATSDTLGGIKVGTGLSITDDGTLSTTEVDIIDDIDSETELVITGDNICTCTYDNDMMTVVLNEDLSNGYLFIITVNSSVYSGTLNCQATVSEEGIVDYDTPDSYTGIEVSSKSPLTLKFSFSIDGQVKIETGNQVWGGLANTKTQTITTEAYNKVATLGITGDLYAGKNHTHDQYALTNHTHDDYLTKSQLIDLFYPIGSIYTSMNSTNPADKFGGTWVQIVDRFLYCTNSGGDEGGSKTISAMNLPSHNHTINIGVSRFEEQGYGLVNNGASFTDRVYVSDTGISMLSSSTGGGQDYMPPYFTVYAWYRKA